MLTDDTFLLLDNASVNKTDQIVRLLLGKFHGHFSYSPRYSPRYKPVERGLSLVKRYIRLREAAGALRTLTPQALIHEGFYRYSIWGPEGCKASRHWKYYKAYHSNYLRSFL